MKEMGKTMTAFKVNPLVYIIPTIILGAVVLYYLYGAIDRVGLDVQSAYAVVTDKKFTPGGATYWTNIAGGRAWTQSQQNPDMYAVSLKVGDEQTVGLVSKPMFESLSINDRVRVKVSRTRLSRQLEVVEVSR